MEFHIKKSQFSVKSRFKEWNFFAGIVIINGAEILRLIVIQALNGGNALIREEKELIRKSH